METRKRKPLSDITNAYNLIPTSALRKLVAASSGSNSLSKHPVSTLKSNSSSKNQKFGSDSSHRSDTSIGSSNVSATGNSRTVHFRTPPRGIASFSSQGGIGSKNVANNLRQTNEKSKKERDAALGIVSPNPSEKRKNKGKAIAVPFRSSPPKIVKESGKGIYSQTYEKIERGKQILNSSGCSMENQEETRKGIADHSSGSLEKRNDGKKDIFMPSGSSIVKTKEMGNEFVTPFSFLVERTKEKGKHRSASSHEKSGKKGKAVLQPSNIVEIIKHKGSSDAVAVNSRPPRRKSGKRKTDAGAFSCPPMLRNKNIQNDLDEAGDIKTSKSWTDQRPKCRKKRSPKVESTSELPPDFIEQQRAYFKEVDEFELPEEEVSEDELD